MTDAWAPVLATAYSHILHKIVAINAHSRMVSCDSYQEASKIDLSMSQQFPLATFTYILHGSEHGQTQVLLASLRGGDSSDHLGTVLQSLLGVESTLSAKIVA